MRVGGLQHVGQILVHVDRPGDETAAGAEGEAQGRTGRSTEPNGVDGQGADGEVGEYWPLVRP